MSACGDDQPPADLVNRQLSIARILGGFLRGWSRLINLLSFNVPAESSTTPTMLRKPVEIAA
jgi:hypothetical protein